MSEDRDRPAKEYAMRRRGLPLLLVMVLWVSMGSFSPMFGATAPRGGDFGSAEESAFGTALARWLAQVWTGWEEVAGLWLADAGGVPASGPGEIDRSGAGVDPNGNPAPRG